jgi:hypothetical protein
MKSGVFALYFAFISIPSCKFLQHPMAKQTSFQQNTPKVEGLEFESFPSTQFSRSLYGKPILPAGSKEPMSYGLEFEGGSPKIWEFFGQDGMHFLKDVGDWKQDQQTIMIDWLMTELVTHGRVIRTLVENGVEISLPKQALPESYDPTISHDLKLDLLENFVMASFDNPMSFMPWEMRKQWVNQWPLKQRFLTARDDAKKQDSACGSDVKLERKNFMKSPYKAYSGLRLLLGQNNPQLELAKKERKGWEILSKPMTSQKDFDELLDWFRTQFGDVENQHKRILFQCDKLCEYSNSYEDFNLFSSYLQMLLYLVSLAQKDNVIESYYSSLRVPQTGWGGIPYVYSQNYCRFDRGLVFSRESALATHYREFSNLSEGHISAEIRIGLGNMGLRMFFMGFVQKWALKHGHPLINLKQRGDEDFWRFYPKDRFYGVKFASNYSGLDRALLDEVDSSLKKIFSKDGTVSTGGSTFQIPIFWGWQNLPNVSKQLPKLKAETQKFVAIFVDAAGKIKSVDKETAKQGIADWVKNTNTISILSEFIWDDSP